MHLVENACKERIYPVGRLDRNTTGLLLITNDGELSEKLMHPSHNIKKIYQVDLDKPLTAADEEKIRNRYDEYNQKTAPLMDYYKAQGKFHSVDGIGSIEEVTERLTKVFDKL
jgi:pseudouridine synthase